MTNESAGRVWLITGATSGFGRSIAEAVIGRGGIVVGAARRPGRLDDLATAYPDRMVGIELDVTDAARCEAVVGEVTERFGRLDLLVNNAGRTQVGALEEMTDEEFRYLFDLHVFGPATLIRAVLPQLRRAGGGVVVQMSSTGGQISGPGFGAYSATKHALEGLTEALRQEVDFGVRFLIVEPGSFRTNLFSPEARPATRQRRPRPSSPPSTRRTRLCGWPSAVTPSTSSGASSNRSSPSSRDGKHSAETPHSTRHPDAGVTRGW